MRIHIVATAESQPHQSLTTLVVDETVALDAGCLVQLPLAAQRRIEHVVLTHAHMDHIASLPMFLDNVYEFGPRCPSVYASRETLNAMSQHLFNDALWPNVMALGAAESPFVRFVELPAESPVAIGELSVTAVPLSHPIPTYGLVLERDGRRAALLTDTGPTHRIWEVLSSKPPHLLLIDVSFPNRLSGLAERSGHLSPKLLCCELQKLPHVVPTLAIHIKPPFYDEVVREIEQLNLPHVTAARLGETYQV
ncbi:MAG: cAMP phosphodiesterase class-II:metallo-beta-lactamase superfamily protein [Pirellulaceae bacterium]|nr:MAG: cAMP phosphodiesterase class-II:metallo-beta-lactamase superfamily protein [Pirellulaceae bacterium]GIW92115.1 MAG: cAMP phosphodiesterase class-II:metallo-beta-lactamase superfamily protein [Pirellulaceae bacterium]